MNIKPRSWLRSSLVAVALLTLGATRASAQAAYVTSVSKTWFGGAGVTETQAFTPAAAHHLLVLGFVWGAGTGANISSVSDGTNTWTASNSTQDGTTGGMGIYYVIDCAAGAHTVSVTWSADPGFGALHLYEVSGTDLTAPLDQHNILAQANPGTGANAYASTATTTTANGEFGFGMTFDEGGNSDTWTKGTAWTAIQQGAGTYSASEQLVQTTAGALTANFTIGANTFSRAVTGIATFKAAGGGGATPCAHGMLGVFSCDEATR